MRIVLILASFSLIIESYGQQVTKDDYARAVSFLGQNLINRKVYNTNVNANWFADSS